MRADLIFAPYICLGCWSFLWPVCSMVLARTFQCFTLRT